MPITLNFSGTRITDAIVGVLTTSQAAYQAAATNALVPITLAEYNALASAFSATKTNASDATLLQTGTAIANANHVIRTTAINSSGQLMTAGYTLAAKVGVLNLSGVAYTNGSTLAINGFQLGFGTTASNAGTALSGLSAASATVANSGNTSFLHFVVKAPSVLSPAGAMPTVRYPTGTHSSATQATVSGVLLSYTAGATDVTTAPAPAWSSGFMTLFQFLQTANKQW